MSCWFGFRHGDPQVEHVARNFQFPPTPAGTYAREIMALRKTLLDALYTNYSGRHTTVSISAALNHSQSEINRHLFSDALTLSTVHIIYDIPFLERHLRDGKEVEVKVVVTIEFYQAPWRAGTRRWNRGGSLDHMSANWHKTDAKVQHNFEETYPISDNHDNHPVQPHVDPVASGHTPHQPTALPAAVAMNLDTLMTYSTQTTATTSGPLNAASQDYQAISSLVSGADLNADDILMTSRSMTSFNKVSIDLSQRTLSGTDSLLELGLSDNITPSSSQGLLDMQQGSPASGSFQQGAQLSFINDGPLAADMWAMLSLPSFPPAHPMAYDPVSSSEVVNNNGDSLCVVVSKLQDDDAPVVNIDAHQPATNPRPAMPAYSRPNDQISTDKEYQPSILHTNESHTNERHRKREELSMSVHRLHSQAVRY
ncbi:hypothetical protein BGX30_013274 [Mortierella sp. GBA39]|nr:hypothetical protein BGX30_013274 [Mortierella sp. GBA39]